MQLIWMAEMKSSQRNKLFCWRKKPCLNRIYISGIERNSNPIGMSPKRVKSKRSSNQKVGTSSVNVACRVAITYISNLALTRSFGFSDGSM